MTVSVLSLRDKSFLGLRLGVIRSDSMENSGMYVGDVVFISRENKYDVGDVIVFYRAVSEYGKLREDADVENKQIWVHKIEKVKVDEFGRQTFLTKGTSNKYDDGFYVPEDFVLGSAVQLPGAVSGIIGFVASVKGIISLIILPCMVMAVYLVWELVVLFTLKELPAYAEAGARNELGLTELFDNGKFYYFTYTAELLLSDGAALDAYNAVRQALLSYKGIRTRRDKDREIAVYKRKPFALIRMRNSILTISFAEENSVADEGMHEEITVTEENLNDILEQINKSAENAGLIRHNRKIPVFTQRNWDYAELIDRDLIKPCKKASGGRKNEAE